MKNYSIMQETPRGEKIDAWIHLLREMFVKLEYARSDETTDKALNAIVEHRTLSNLDIHLVSSTKQSLLRVPQKVTDNEGEYFLVVMQVSGTGEVTQDGRRAILAQGDFTLYDTTRPYALDFGADFQQLVVSVPRDILRVQVPGAQNLTAYHISGDRPIGRLLREMVRGLPAAIDECTEDTLPFVSDAVVDLIAANLRSLTPGSPRARSKMARYQEERIKTFIKANATDAEITVGKIAEALEMSVSAMYRAFENQQVSLAELLWLERLSAASSALRDRSLAVKSIKEIAFDNGFSDAAHFSRIFRQKFGVSPRQFRLSAS